MFDFQTKVDLKKGEPAAYKLVFMLLYPRLKGYCKLFISDNSLVEDIIQESFVTLWEKRDSINVEKSVESLLFVIVRNRCLNELRKQKLEEGRISTDDLKVTELQYLYQLDFTDKEEKSLEEMLIESFKKAVNELPEKMRAVFVMCKIDGKSQKETADELGISLKMVEKHISKAKEQIRIRLIKQYPAVVALIILLLE